MRICLLLLGIYLLAALLSASGLFPLATGPEIEAAPSLAHPFGTDQLGRDLLLWSMHGSRVAVIVGSVAAGMALLLGTVAGLLAGWYGGRLDALMLWLSGSVAAIPNLLLILLLSWLLGGGYLGVFLAVGCVSWVGIYRLVRSEVQRMRALPYVTAAISQGASAGHLMRQHLLPNLRAVLGAQFLLHFVFAVKAEALLSFLGVGMHETPSWGRMIAEAWAFDDLGEGRWWRLLAASLAMAGLVLALQGLTERLGRAQSSASKR